MLQLGAGDQRLDARVGLDLSKRFKFIAERKNLVTARFKHASDDQPGRTAWFD
jgi:hypothetical protein